jgi:AP-1 complex subunit beta-1
VQTPCNGGEGKLSAQLSMQLCILNPLSLNSFSDDQFSTQKALQTVAAGQQAENLLDFDDTPSDQPSGLAATQVSSTPAAVNLLAGTSSNPLDDLVSIFGNMGGSSQPAAFGGSPVSPQQPNALAGLGIGGIGSPPSVASPVQAQGAEDDLLGLF